MPRPPVTRPDDQLLDVVVRGVVQGVGFRPFVHALATRLGLRGSVANRGGHVRIEAEGAPEALAALLTLLRAEAPPPARIDDLRAVAGPARGLAGFSVEPSDEVPEGGETPPDLGPCDACLREVTTPADRRAGYPFTTCSACGPRYTVIRALPYDRARTTLAPFDLCPACRAEYDDPAHRRFHVEGQACPACGPRLSFTRGAHTTAGPDALARAREVVLGGGVLALKGVGGYQLACLSTDEGAVASLRSRKNRPDKPLALCARDLAQAREVALLPPGAEEALTSPERPIVLLPKRLPSRVAPGVAPGLAELGVMLPASPLHALLLAGAEAPWVLTSGNVHGRPLVIDDAAARAELGHVADAFLWHDRAVHARADDSVVQLFRGRTRLLRRARGHAPRSIALPVAGPDLVALGGDLKATVCVVAGGRATVSPHVGDVSAPEVEAALKDALSHLVRLTGAAPRAVACDRHPDYVTARVARELGLPVVAVQHHHAHAAACLVEHGRAGPALVVAFDGAGHGDDGTTWGGELLVADLRAARRVGRLRPVALPGGDLAAREPWRAALAHLVDAGVDADLEALLPGVDPRKVEGVRELLARGVACPLASSAGRLFDAAAALCGLRAVTTYEGQAAVELEAACAPDDEDTRLHTYPLDLSPGQLPALDTRPLVRALVRDLRAEVPVPRVAARFHAGLAAGVVRALERLRADTGLALVLLVGGVFQNRRLLGSCEDALRARGFEVLSSSHYPAGDGGLCLGQAAVAAATVE